MWESIKMYKAVSKIDKAVPGEIYYVINDNDEIDSGPFNYMSEAQERADELNEGK